MSAASNEMALSPQQALSGRRVRRISGFQSKAINESRCPRLNARLSQAIRIGTLNVGSLTGRSQEIIEMIGSRNIDVCCFQETKWKSGVRLFSASECKYKMFWTGQKSAQCGVAIVIKEELAKEVLEVKRYNARLMLIKIRLRNRLMTIVSAYAPQSGECEEVKDEFWSLMADVVQSVPMEESIVIGGDLNGHVGKTAEGFECSRKFRHWRTEY